MPEAPMWLSGQVIVGEEMWEGRRVVHAEATGNLAGALSHQVELVTLARHRHHFCSLHLSYCSHIQCGWTEETRKKFRYQVFLYLSDSKQFELSVSSSALWPQCTQYLVSYMGIIFQNITLYLSKIIFCLGCCGSVDWVPACETKGRWFHSQSGYVPGLQAGSPVGGAQEATTYWCFSPSLLPFPCL